MAQITLKGNAIETIGTLPQKDQTIPDFTLTASDLSSKSPSSFAGKKLILNIFPSIDTPVCAASVRKFNEEINKRDDAVVLCISADLPFAHTRFCEGEGLDKVIPLSSFKSPKFGEDYGQTITTGPIAGLLARAALVVDENGRVLYSEQVPEIAEEPNYAAILDSLG